METNLEFSRDLVLPFPLREYQWEGVSFLYRSEGALLADEMGLGKTVQVAVALRLLVRAGIIHRALIVVPVPLQTNWQRELEKWAPELSIRLITGRSQERRVLYMLPASVLLVAYDNVRDDVLELPSDETFDLVVLDEAQRIKNASSQTALACRLLPRTRSWAMSATPVENSVDDLASVFAFIRPGLLTSAHSRSEMLERTRPYRLRRRKFEVLPELPPVITQELVLELTAEQRAAYDSVWSDRVGAAKAGTDRGMGALFALLTRLKLLCNFEPTTGASSKLEALRGILEEASENGQKVLVFSQYVRTLEWLRGQIVEMPTLSYHGSLGREDRDEVVAKFEEAVTPVCLLMSLRAGGVGLNLASADVVVMFDRWWNPAVEKQAAYRAHRFERSGPLLLVEFLVAETVEERIAAVLSEKQALFQEVVEEAEGAVVSPLSAGEILRILEIAPSEFHAPFAFQQH
jgi:SNF2 family DNA or RNA helicase